MRTARILVPAVYLDACHADPHPDMPRAVAALLANAEITGRGHNQHAVIHVPAEELPALDAVALTQFHAWGDAYTRRPASMPREDAEALRSLSRAAYQVHHQARYAASPDPEEF